MQLPATLAQFIGQHIEQPSEPLCIEYDEQYRVVRTYGPSAHYGLHDIVIGEGWPESLDFLQEMGANKSLNLSYVTLPNGIVCHIFLRTEQLRRFIVFIDTTGRYQYAQAQQQLNDEMTQLEQQHQQTVEQLCRVQAALSARDAELAAARQHNELLLNTLTQHLIVPMRSVHQYIAELSQAGSVPINTNALRQVNDYGLYVLRHATDQVQLVQGQMIKNPAPHNINQLLALANAVFQPLARQRDLNLRILSNNQIPERLVMDMRYVQVLLFRLLDNAIQSSSDGTIQAQATYDNGDLILQVKDTSPVLSDKENERIHHNDTLSTTHGTNDRIYNLALCHHLSTTLHGYLEVEPTSEGGQLYRLRFPAATPDQTPLPQLQGQAVALSYRNQELSELNQLLGDWGLEPIAMNDVSALREWLEDQRSATSLPELLVVRHNPDNEQDIIAMELIRQLDPELPVIVLCDTQEQAQLGQGDDDVNCIWLSHPISAARLHQSISQLLPHMIVDEASQEMAE